MAASFSSASMAPDNNKDYYEGPTRLSKDRNFALHAFARSRGARRFNFKSKGNRISNCTIQRRSVSDVDKYSCLDKLQATIIEKHNQLSSFEIVFGAVETHALAASFKGGLAEVTTPDPS
ncbi:hypothetical protein ACFE04_001666 [Oxalis oulophora]